MTPKEKAKELISKYWYVFSDESIDIKCALIAVDEILNLETIDNESGYCIIPINDTLDFKQYWKEVKQEIEKL